MQARDPSYIALASSTGSHGGSCHLTGFTWLAGVLVVSVVLAGTSSPFLLSLFLFFSLALYSTRQEIEIFAPYPIASSKLRAIEFLTMLNCLYKY